MDGYKISWLSVFGFAAVTTLGCKFGALIWDKYIISKFDKNSK